MAVKRGFYRSCNRLFLGYKERIPHITSIGNGKASNSFYKGALTRMPTDRNISFIHPVYQNSSDKIDAIKAALSLTSLFAHYHVKQGKGNQNYHCPFHEDKKPSLSITNEGKLWKCFAGCGSGDIFQFIQQIENCSFPEAIKKAGLLAGIHLDTPQDRIKKASPLAKKHLDYLLNARGIKPATALKLGLKARGDFILFPQKRNGIFAGYKRRHMTDKKKMGFEGPDRTAKFWPENPPVDTEELWLVSGEYEACILLQVFPDAAIRRKVAITNSTGELSYPKDILQTLQNISSLKKVCILYDNDIPGKTGARKVAEAICSLDIPIEIYSFPEDKPEKYDLVDFFKEGYSLKDLYALKHEIFEKADKAIGVPDFKFITPENYIISKKGISKVTFNPRTGEPKIEEISASPVIITQRAINTDEKTIRLELAFSTNGTWERIFVDRETISDSRQIVTLSANGFPVHSDNARKMVAYLSAFEHANIHQLKTVYLTHSNGWKTFNNQKVYGLGSNIIGLKEDSEQISFKPEPGFERFERSLHTHGSLERWKQVVKPILPFNNAAFALYASFAGPLLTIVDAPNFIIHYWGESSLGKTTVLELAASVWGNPAKETGGLVTSWNNTQVFIERIASFFNDLPLFLDDSQTVDDKIISKILYMVANSVGRGRGTKEGGVRDLLFWHTVCFSTGERQITDSTQYDGAKARTIELAGSPFKRHQGKLVNSIKSGTRENYAHAGLEYMKNLFPMVEDPKAKEALRERYRKHRDTLSSKANNEIGDRIAHYFAVIWLAGELAETFLNLGGNPSEIVQSIFEETINDQQSGGDMATRALQDVVSFAQANMKSFMGKSDETVREHFGVWRDAEYIAFYPHKLKDFLGKQGYSYNSVLKSWSDRKWLKREPSRLTSKIWYETNHFRMVIVKWETISEHS